MGTTHFGFAFEPRYRWPARLFGITASSTWILVDDLRLAARFGPWHIETPLANITRVSRTGPYAFVKTAGPARLGLTDRGLTFATTSRAGVCIDFVDPITGIDPLGVIRHPNLTVTPQDVTGLAALLTRAMTPS